MNSIITWEDIWNGQVWERSVAGEDLRSLTIIHGFEGPAGDQLVLGRDRLGAKAIDPELLIRDWVLVKQSPRPPARRRIVIDIPEPSPEQEADRITADAMTDRQRIFLEKLCNEAGRAFDEALTKREASEQISKLLAASVQTEKVS